MTSTLSVLQLVVLFSIWSTIAFSQDTVILVCDLNPAKISRISLKNFKVEKLATSNISRPVAIDYDETTRTVYWTDVNLKQIRATKPTGVGDRVVLSLANNSEPDGLAVDTGLQKVFYTDAGRNMIAEVDMDGRNHKKLITSGLDKPLAIVLYQETRKFYFTDCGAKPFIAVANYEGISFVNIYTTGLISPNGLALDKTSNMLFWCDRYTKKIETGSVYGVGRRVLAYGPTSQLFDIFLFEDVLYFTDFNRQAVLSMPKSGGVVGLLVSTNITKLAGLHVYSTAPKCGIWPPCLGCDKCETHSACEKRLGICLAGCQRGYRGNGCKEKCPSGSYGENCANSCAPCKYGTCHHEYGFCYNGSDGRFPVFQQHLPSLLPLIFLIYFCP